MSIDSDTDRAVIDAVNAVRAGDALAHETIVRHFQRTVTTLCTAILKDRQAAEELAQDVFVKAYQRLDTFDVRRPMKPWLAKIAYRLAQQRWRSAASCAKHRRELAEAVQRRNCATATPLDGLIQQEQSDLLWRAVYNLPITRRTAVVLYYRERLPLKQIADVMCVTSGTVKTHLFRARTQLRANLLAPGCKEGSIQ
jgi:RNA polymerase sigma factor (sigma-70 family)